MILHCRLSQRYPLDDRPDHFFLITAFILKLLKVVLNPVEAGRLQLHGIHPETVGATRKLISVVVWLFALSAAYPFCPVPIHWRLKVSAFSLA